MGKLLPNQQLCNEEAAKNRGIGIFLNMHLCAPEKSLKSRNLLAITSEFEVFAFCPCLWQHLTIVLAN